MAWISNIFNVKCNLYIQWLALVLCLFQSLWHHFCGLWHNAYTISHVNSRVIVTVVHGLAVVFVQSIVARCLVKDEDVVGAVPTGNVPTTSECQWSTILLPAKVGLILEVWWQGKKRKVFSSKICGMMKKHTFLWLISFLHLGKYTYPGWYDPAGNLIRCMWYAHYIDWLVYIRVQGRNTF